MGLWWRRRAHHTAVQEESLTVIKDLGVQTRTRLFNGQERVTFIEKERVGDIVIHEAFSMMTVIHCMLIEEGGGGGSGGDSVVVHHAFRHFRPRLATLLRILRGVREVVMDEKQDARVVAAAEDHASGKDCKGGGQSSTRPPFASTGKTQRWVA